MSGCAKEYEGPGPWRVKLRSKVANKAPSFGFTGKGVDVAKRKGARWPLPHGSTHLDEYRTKKASVGAPLDISPYLGLRKGRGGWRKVQSAALVRWL